MTLQTERLRTMEQVRAFVEGSEPVDCQPKDRGSAYAFVRRTLAAFDYHRLGRADRGCVRAYIGKARGFSAAQISRLIRQQAETGAVADRRARNSGRPFETVYTAADIRLLAEVDEASRGDVGAGDLRDPAPRARRAWRRPLRAAGGRVALAPLQPARDAHLPDEADDLGEDAAQPGGDRGSARRPSRTAGRASCGWTPSIWATGTGARACTSSTSWTR